MKQTKGKWTAFTDNTNGFGITNGNTVIAIAGEVDLKENEANANLIASAPEMLKALKGVNQCLDNQFQHKDELIPAWIVDAYEIIEETIAKAEGK
tara:strand:+ start:1683 stop:1967 length:285 start_codon:yes stop_codon:yes gene_type:complete